MRVLVVGAGVVGLSCAVRLLEAGHRVDVVARDLPGETTSVRAAALWYPYLASPRERVLGWAARSYEVFDAIAAADTAAGTGEPPSGVRMLPGTEAHAAATDDPWWRSAVPSLERVTPPDGFADAWSFASPVVDMPVYLGWLAARVRSLGGTVTRLNLAGLPPGGDLVVNCSAIGSRLLAADPSVTPVAGQVVHLEQFGLERWWLCGEDDDGDQPTYVVPRGDHVVVGGTAEPGQWSRTPSARTTTAILERAARLVPEVAGARVLRQQVGLRPARPEVRVEREARIVHCYGHGGAGVTLSWGCADEVVALARGSVTPSGG